MAKNIVVQPLDQVSLQRYYLLRKERLELEALVRKISKAEDKVKTRIETLLKRGSPCEEGMFTAQFVPGGRYPKWKDAFIQACGEDKAAEVEANTPYTQKLEITVAEGFSEEFPAASQTA